MRPTASIPPGNNEDQAPSTLEHTLATRFPDLAAAATPEVPDDARVTWTNDELASELGLTRALTGPDRGLAFLTGTQPDARTFALGYSGYQFGHLSPILGDGRAHLVGEWIMADGSSSLRPADPRRFDLHLKGSGRTPFSRPGSDGKAPLGAVWREVVIGEALHALGVPTSRALAVIDTGEHVRRRGPEPEPAGILVRTASSHLRVGTFQYAQMQGDETMRRDLVNYALERHYPHLSHAGVDTGTAAETEHWGVTESSALTLLRVVAMRQADLVAQWMGLGFVHGVLNTDNVSIPGESIDFGPCAFIDTFRHAAVFSSIDEQGRYSYRNQPAITQWNLARFAETLLDLINPDDPNAAIEAATQVLHDFEARYRDAWTSVFAAKLGLRTLEGDDEHENPVSGEPTASERVRSFAERTLDLLEQDSLDFTGFFRTLTDAPDTLRALTRMPATADTWLAELRDLRAATGTSADVAQALMEASNPVYIPRNHHLESALRAIERGEKAPLERILDAVRDPYTRRSHLANLETPPPNARSFTSFCGT